MADLSCSKLIFSPYSVVKRKHSQVSRKKRSGLFNRLSLVVGPDLSLWQYWGRRARACSGNTMTRGWSLIFSNSILCWPDGLHPQPLCCSNWCLPAETTVPRNCQQAWPSRATTGPLTRSPSGSTAPRSECDCCSAECREWQECWVPSYILITFYI